MEYKVTLGVIAVVVAFISYIPYFRDIFTGKTKPHAFTWLIWGVLNAIAFAGQLHDKAGAGAWAVGFTAAVLITIFCLALVKGEKNILPFDWFCLSGAGASLVLWALTSDPLVSIVLVTIIDALGFLPTVRKSFNKPYEETLFTYALSTLKYLLVVFALEKYSVVTVLFPFSLVLMNGLFVLMLAVRRQQLKT